MLTCDALFLSEKSFFNSSNTPPSKQFWNSESTLVVGKGGGGDGGEQNVVDKSVKRLKDIQLARIEDNI